MAGTDNPPLAPHCSLCGDGYHPTLKIDISSDPNENSRTGDLEYRWVHVQCLRDHDRMFLKAFNDNDHQW